MVIAEDGELAWEKLRSNMTEFLNFMELRLNGVEQLGQVRTARIIPRQTDKSALISLKIKDVAGVAIFFLSTVRHALSWRRSAGDYACVRCEVLRMNVGEKQLRPRCAKSRMGRRQAGLNALFNSENIGFIRLIRRFCCVTHCRIFSSHCFTHCGACH